jgi:hypothetical protein
LPLLERLPDRFEHGFRILEHQTVFESENLHPVPFQQRSPLGIAFGGLREDPVMCRAVEFDNDATFRTIKVDDIRTNTVLTSKLFPKVSVLERPPE